MGDKMDQVDCCVKDDIPAIARIHLKIFGNPNDEPSEGLKSYYEMVLCGHPWCDEELPSLVYRSKEGNVEGFVGVITRRMNFKGKSIRVAVPHRLMVAPDCNSPMAVLKIIKRFLAGPQDLSLGDGANDLGKKFMEGMGATTSKIYSMNWLCFLRPFSVMRNLAGKYNVLKWIGAASWPVCSLMDSLALKIPRSPLRPKHPDGCTAKEIDSQALLSCIGDFSKRRPLYPEYDTETIQWLWDFLKSNTQRGQLRGYEVRNAKDKRIGAYLYYLNSKKMMEVMLLLAREDSTDIVFSHLLSRAFDCGAIGVGGRMEPRFLQSMWSHHCFVKRGSWAVVHAKDPEILNVINRGDAILSALEGELWLRSPGDML